VTKQSVQTTTLSNGNVDLIKFQVAADSAGTVALKQVAFNVAINGTVTLTNFRVRKGSSDMALADVAFTDGAGGDLETGSISANGMAILSFTNQEPISGSGNVYTIYATVSNAGPGESVALSFYRDPLVPVVTGYLVNSSAIGAMPNSADVYNIDTSVAPSGAATDPGTFLWSDESDTPHSSAVGTSGGSRDWTNDVYVDDVSQTQTLSL
jgi:hypothetical protein